MEVIDNKINNESLNIDIRYVNNTFRDMFTNKTEQMNLVRNSNKIKSNEPSPGDTNGAVSPPNAFNTSNIKL